MFTILTIDDEENIRNGLADNFELEGYNVKKAANGKEGLNLIAKGDIDLVITDLRMDGISGEEVVRHVTTENPGIPIIVLTGHGSIDDATAAIKAGAYDFLTKPLDLDHLNLIVKNALKGRSQSKTITELQEKLKKSDVNTEMIGKSAELNRVKMMIQKAAPTKASVLITGESGVGKELVAKAIHNNSPRKDKPLITVHCAALSETLLESELFGHEKGAFTGADNLQKGRFELADGGSIFLDEIGEINQATQVKLLRVLQEKSFEKLRITDIYQKSFVSRATFYRLFDSLQDVIVYECDCIYMRLAKEIKQESFRSKQDFFIYLIESWLKQEVLIKTLVENNMINVIYETHMKNTELMKKIFLENVVISDSEADYLISVLANIIPAALNVWVLHGKAESSIEIYKKISRSLDIISKQLN